MGSQTETLFVRRGEEFYSLDRDSKESARLNLQHQLLKHNFGYLLHPSIPVTKHGLRIAEFATGTAIWLREVSEIVDPDCKLDGYDISAAQFPSRDSLPSNISLMEHDILKPLSDEYSGYYDIISVRALVTALADDEWETAVRNMARCLKPGGYMQWIDCDLSPHGTKVVQSEPMAQKAALQEGLDIMGKWATLLGRHLDSCSTQLGSIFRSQRFQGVYDEMVSSDWNADCKIRKEWSMEVSTGLKPLFVRYAQMSGSAISVQHAAEVSDRMLKEAELGKAYLRLDWLIVTGKKPLAS